MARFAGRVGLLACDLHALSALGSPWGMATFVEAVAERASGRSPCRVFRFHHRACSPACGWRAKKNGPEQALGRSRGGFSTKIHAVTVDENCAVALHLTPGHAHDGRQFESLYESIDPENVIDSAALLTQPTRKDDTHPSSSRGG